MDEALWLRSFVGVLRLIDGGVDLRISMTATPSGRTETLVREGIGAVNARLKIERTGTRLRVTDNNADADLIILAAFLWHVALQPCLFNGALKLGMASNFRRFRCLRDAAPLAHDFNYHLNLLLTSRLMG
jgi:hypothetical protein